MNIDLGWLGKVVLKMMRPMKVCILRGEWVKEDLAK